MAKIVYLFGAGASVGTLPLVNEMSDRLSELIKTLSSSQFLLSESEIFNDLEVGQNQSKERHRRDMLNALTELKSICDNHFSIDTFAKKLTIRGDTNGLKKLKISLCVFFVFEQLIHRPNSRYDFFFASLIESIYRLPNNIRILSWNYDSQFEIAFSEFSQKKDISVNQDLLRVFNRANRIIRSDVEGFSIFKLNGSTELRFQNNRPSGTYYFNLDSSSTLDRNHLEQIVKSYVSATYYRDLVPSFKFAWEQEFNSEFTKIIIEETKDADVLVVIGYSFPYFNRTVDKGIISEMKNLSRVYFQSPEAKELIERFKSIKDDLSEDKLIPISDVKYFYIPNELS
jgi:hypothetical protein